MEKVTLTWWWWKRWGGHPLRTMNVTINGTPSNSCLSLNQVMEQMAPPSASPLYVYRLYSCFQFVTIHYPVFWIWSTPLCVCAPWVVIDSYPQESHLTIFKRHILESPAIRGRLSSVKVSHKEVWISCIDGNKRLEGSLNLFPVISARGFWAQSVPSGRRPQREFTGFTWHSPCH